MEKHLYIKQLINCVKADIKNAKLVALGQREHCKGFVFKYLD